MKLDTFTAAYIECALWAETDDNSEPLDDNYGVCDISEECLKQMLEDCAKFQAENWDRISDDLESAGYDFWLTRNGHGAGFWAGNWPEHGDYLTEQCKAYGEVYLYVGDDDKIYC